MLFARVGRSAVALCVVDAFREAFSVVGTLFSRENHDFSRKKCFNAQKKCDFCGEKRLVMDFREESLTKTSFSRKKSGASAKILYMPFSRALYSWDAKKKKKKAKSQFNELELYKANVYKI